MSTKSTAGGNFPTDWITPTEYKRMRDAYRPARLRAVFLLESPPKSGKYFYNRDGKVTEPLFKAMMEFIGIADKIKSKEDGLREFQDRGFFVVDASYDPVNNLKGKARDQMILRGFRSLVQDLNLLDPGRKAKVVLVKKNICELMEPRLTREGFVVANKGDRVFFPGSGRQADFRRQIKLVAKKSGLRTAAPTH